MNIKKIILAAALSTTALSAFAVETPAEKSRDYYVQFNTGFGYGMKPGSGFQGKNMGNTSIFGVEAGGKVYENVRASLSFDYMPGFKDKNTNTTNLFSVTGGNLTKTSHDKIKVKSYVAMANLYYDLGEFNKFTPYLTIGAGIARNKSGQFTQNQTFSNGVVQTLITSSATKNNFAYKLGFGTRYSLNSAFDLDLRYQYQDLGKFKTGVTQAEYFNGSVENITVVSQSGKLRTQELLLGIAYKF